MKYGNDDGGWIDESTPPSPSTATGAVLRETEELLADRTPQAVLLHGVQGGVHGHAPRPRLKRPLTSVLVEAGKELDKRVLQGIFRFDPTEQLRLYQAMDEADEEIVVVYHSHTATEAYPSRTDIGLASEPNAHYVLVSTRAHGNSDGPVEFRSYRITDGVVTEEDVTITPTE